MGNGHQKYITRHQGQISISLATVHIWVLKDTKSYGTDMGIKGHQSSISLATVQTWVLKDTKSVYHSISLATVQTWVLKDTKSVYH